MTSDPQRQPVDRALSVHAAAEECPDRTALIVQDGRSWTWAELSAEVGRVTSELDPGIEVLVATSTPATIVRMLAAIERGIPLAPIDPRINRADRRARIALLAGDSGAGREAGAEAGAEAIPAPEDRRPLALLFTSGSTGVPRAVELSRAAFVASALASEQRLGWRDGDRWLCVLPLAHVGGLSILIRCLAARRTVVLLPRFDAELVDEAIVREAVTLASFVPTMLSRLLARDSGWRAPASLRAILLGGAPAPDALWANALARGLPVLETWGMTETCSQVATAIPGEAARSPVPLQGWSVRSRAGRLEVKGPALLTRYVEHEPRAVPFTADGWFTTGDTGTVNPDGSVTLGGRADDMIVTGGENVSPLEVERVLESAHGVRRAVVVGLPDSEWGQIVAAALESDADRGEEHAPGMAPTPDIPYESDLQAVINTHLATYQRPRRIIWVQRLPETPAGKIDRTKVRQVLLRESADGEAFRPSPAS